MVPDDLLIKC